jgi:hypothetical protein
MSESNDFSSVKTYRHDEPEQPPVHPAGPDRRKIFRIIIALLAMGLIILLGLNYLTSPLVGIASGKGDVRGHVIDEQGLPAQANVIIFGTDLSTKTDQNGNFILKGVQEGSQILVVSHNISAVEIPITILPGQEINVGQIQFKVTAQP